MYKCEDRMIYERTKLVRAELDKTKANVHSVHPDVAKAAKEKQKEMLDEIKLLSEQQGKAQAAWQETVKSYKVWKMRGCARNSNCVLRRRAVAAVRPSTRTAVAPHLQDKSLAERSCSFALLSLYLSLTLRIVAFFTCPCSSLVLVADS
jgi:hypothetical protein